MRSTLTPWQHQVLQMFFARERGFFLTGGGALAGYHLGHRVTDDLDLFTTDDQAFERGPHVLADLAAHASATLTTRQITPRFRRYVLATPTTALVVDLVHDSVPDEARAKITIEDVILDSAAEILANKLTALVGRAEERDLIDVMFLERAGHSIEQALPRALAKDGGCTPANLAWLLSQIEVPDDIHLPAAVEPHALRSYLEGLIQRLRRLALPPSA